MSLKRSGNSWSIPWLATMLHTSWTALALGNDPPNRDQGPLFDEARATGRSQRSRKTQRGDGRKQGTFPLPRNHYPPRTTKFPALGPNLLQEKGSPSSSAPDVPILLDTWRQRVIGGLESSNGHDGGPVSMHALRRGPRQEGYRLGDLPRSRAFGKGSGRSR